MASGAILLSAKNGADAELDQLLTQSGDADRLSYRGAGTPDAVVGNTALHWASAKGHEACVSLLLAAGADVHARNNGDSTALHSAAISGHAACARILVGARADPNLADEYGDSPLKLAERAGLTDVVDAMLGGGRSPAAPTARTPAAPTSPLRSPDGQPAVATGRRRSADDHREMGNECFKAAEYDGTYAHYSAALALAAADGDGDAARERRAALYSNRSGALAALDRWEDAEADARAPVELRPRWFKGHSRLGAALESLGRLDEAVRTYALAAQLDGAADVTRDALPRCALDAQDKAKSAS
jgi:tetratricopeptide (TPR) repeat protein